ncbi:hypothetical protein DUPY_06260 [Duganella phyllosphaerae]|uniref:Secreted protein n=1 Tax=Duganella phyllosphaerae TaxID=762836 RepID=A0A1E7X6M9_9BURK|nr:hypothetical protein DUPY_06260 [Duganella phyllosphaerae]
MVRTAALSSTTSTCLPASAASNSVVASGAGSGGRATLKWKRLPCPGVLSTPITPPMARTSCCEIARPSPVPPYRRVVLLSAWLKAWNRRRCCSALMPTPLSITANRKRSASGSGPGPVSRVTCSTISPRAVNLRALPTRLISTWPRRSGSPLRRAGTSGSAQATSSRPFSAARHENRSATWSSTSARSNGTLSSASLPDSILEKSSTSSMMPSRFLPARSILWK